MSKRRYQYSKLRRPSKDNRKDWMRVHMLMDYGYSFQGEVNKQMWFDVVEKRPVPQTMAELEQAFIVSKHVKDHKEFKKLKQKYYKERANNYNELPYI